MMNKNPTLISSTQTGSHAYCAVKMTPMLTPLKAACGNLKSFIGYKITFTEQCMTLHAQSRSILNPKVETHRKRTNTAKHAEKKGKLGL